AGHGGVEGVALGHQVHGEALRPGLGVETAAGEVEDGLGDVGSGRPAVGGVAVEGVAAGAALAGAAAAQAGEIGAAADLAGIRPRAALHADARAGAAGHAEVVAKGVPLDPGPRVGADAVVVVVDDVVG